MSNLIVVAVIAGFIVIGQLTSPQRDSAWIIGAAIGFIVLYFVLRRWCITRDLENIEAIHQSWVAWAEEKTFSSYRANNSAAFRGDHATCTNCGGHKMAMVVKAHTFDKTKKNNLGLDYLYWPGMVFRSHICGQCGNEVWRSSGRTR